MLILFAKNRVLQSERSDLLRDPFQEKPVHETNFNVEQAHERTGRFVITHDVINGSESSQTRSAHESETFNVEDHILRERTGRPVIDHDILSHESIMVNEANMDFPNSRTTTFCCEACAEHMPWRIDSEN